MLNRMQIENDMPAIAREDQEKVASTFLRDLRGLLKYDKEVERTLRKNAPETREKSRKNLIRAQRKMKGLMREMREVTGRYHFDSDLLDQLQCYSDITCDMIHRQPFELSLDQTSTFRGHQTLPEPANDLVGRKTNSVCFDASYIGEDGVEELTDQLDRLPDVEILDLSHNEIDDSHAEKIAHQLPLMPNLFIVHMSYNNITNHGATLLLAQLDEHKNLGLLNLVGNHLSNQFRQDAFSKYSGRVHF